MATLDTHKAIQKLQDAGAPEPLAEATVEVVEEAADKPVGRDYLRAELHRMELRLGGFMAGFAAAVAGISVGVSELLK